MFRSRNAAGQHQLQRGNAPSESSGSESNQHQLPSTLLLESMGVARERSVVKDMAWLQATEEDDPQYTQQVRDTLNRIRGMAMTRRIRARLGTAFKAHGPLIGQLFAGTLAALVALIGVSIAVVIVASVMGVATAAAFAAHAYWKASKSHVVYVERELWALLQPRQRDVLQVNCLVSAELWSAIFNDEMLVTVYDPLNYYATVHMLLEDKRAPERGRYELRLLAILEMVCNSTEAHMLNTMHKLNPRAFVFKRLQNPSGKFGTRMAHCQGKGCGEEYPIQTRQPGQAPGLLRRAVFRVRTPTMTLYLARPEDQGAPDMVRVVESLEEEAQARQESSEIDDSPSNPPLAVKGGCWVLPYNLVLNNRGIQTYLDRHAAQEPPRLIRSSVVDMLGITAAMEFSYGRLHFRMSYEFSDDQRYTFGHIAVPLGCQPHEPRSMGLDGRDHIRVIAYQGVLTTGQVRLGHRIICPRFAQGREGRQ